METLAAWRQKHFGSPLNEGKAHDNADPDGDTLENIMEHALGLDPNDASFAQGVGGLPTAGVAVEDGAHYIVFRFETPCSVLPDIRYSVERNVGLEASRWGTYVEKNGASDWPISNFGRSVVTVENVPNERTQVTVFGSNISRSNRPDERYYRLRVQRFP